MPPLGWPVGFGYRWFVSSIGSSRRGLSSLKPGLKGSLVRIPWSGLWKNQRCKENIDAAARQPRSTGAPYLVGTGFGLFSPIGLGTASGLFSFMVSASPIIGDKPK